MKLPISETDAEAAPAAAHTSITLKGWIRFMAVPLSSLLVNPTHGRTVAG
jgi:hypothetical protein